MKVLTACRALPVALTALAVVAASLSLAGGAQAQEKSRADRCSEVLQKQYGAAELSGVDQHNSASRRSVYTDATLGNGQTVRFRCLFSERNTPEVQVYAPQALGSPNPGSHWSSADAYQVPPTAETAKPAAQPAAGDKKAEGDASGQTDKKAEGFKKPDDTAKPEGFKAPGTEKKAEGATKPDGTTKPDTEKKAEGDKKPEGDKKAEGTAPAQPEVTGPVWKKVPSSDS